MNLFRQIKIYAIILKWYLITRYFRKFNTRNKLIKWQHRQVKKIFKYAKESSQFYKELYSGLAWEDWNKLPKIDKVDFMTNFDDLNTVGIAIKDATEVAVAAESNRNFSPMIGNITVGLSSGTSGSQGVFLLSDKERYSWAGAILAKMLPRSIFSKHSIAFFLRANSNLYTSLKSKRVNFVFFDLLEGIDLHIQRLNAMAPTVLVAPPSMLRILSEKMINGDLTIKPLRVISVAEILEPIDKLFIEAAFQENVHQIYQATEGFIATSCVRGVLHLNEDLLYIEKEFIDDKLQKFVPIITDLYRTSQPIIKYRLNDVLTLREPPCDCGSIFTAIEQIDGRCDDLFYMPGKNNNSLQPIFPDFIRRAIITSSDKIEEYSVEQNDLSTITVRIKSRCHDEKTQEMQIKNNLSRMFDKLGCKITDIKFAKYAAPRKGEKLRRIKRLFKIENR